MKARVKDIPVGTMSGVVEFREQFKYMIGKTYEFEPTHQVDLFWNISESHWMHESWLEFENEHNQTE